MSDKALIGKRIKQYRKLRGLTQDQLAEKIGVSTGYLSGIERGCSFPRFENLIQIMNVIEASPDQIFVDVVEKTYETRVSILSDELEKLSPREQKRIFTVVEAMIQEAKEDM